MEIKYWAGTDVGRKRSDNEDNFLIDKRLRLFVVADGMGGHASGEIASAMAVHGIREVLHQERDILDVYDDDDPKSHVEVCTLLEYAVHHTCATIFNKARREPEKRGMGTTLVVLLLIGARGFIAYVGDSRIYLLRGGVVYQLTEDHSLRNELIRMGKITADEFESSPYANLKNAMTRAVGVYESVEVDTLDFDIIPGDAFLLCSDGLYEYLTDEDIAHAIALPEIREVPGMLIDAANSRGGKDNITAVVVQVAGDADDDDRAAELNFTLDTLKNVPLFRELSYQQLVRVINLSRQSALEPGEVLCREGEPGHELMVVLRGRVELTQGGVRVAELGAGSHLGEMSLIDEGLRSVTVIAREPGKVLAIGRDDFYEVLRREPALAVKLLWSFVRVLAGRLRTTTADLAVARTSAAQAMPDLTELAEETTRAVMRPPLAADEAAGDEDELEQQPTMTSRLQSASALLLETRRTLVATKKAPPEPAPAEGAAAPAAGTEAGAAAADAGVVSSAASRPQSGALEGSEGVASPRARASSTPAITGDTVAAPRPRASSNPAITGDTVVPPSAAPRPRQASNPAITGDTVVPPSAAPRPRQASSPIASPSEPAPPKPATAGPVVSGELGSARPVVPAPPATFGEPASSRAAAGSSPVVSGELGSTRPVVPAPPATSGEATPSRATPPAPPATSGEATSARPAVPAPPATSGASSPVVSGELGSTRPPAPPAEAAKPRSTAASSPIVPGDLSQPLPPTSPMISGDLLPPPPRAAASNPAITGHTVVPPAGAPRGRRAPQVTKPHDSSWTPGPRPLGGPPVVPSPQAPTAPLDAPHLIPPAETDAPKTRRTTRRSAIPTMPGTPFSPAPPAAPPPIHAAPTAPLAAPLPPTVVASAAAPTAPLVAPLVPTAIPPMAPPPVPPIVPLSGAPTAPLAAPPPPPPGAPTAFMPDVPSRREETVTAPALPVVTSPPPPPPPPPPRGGTLPPPGRSTTQPPPPPPPRTDADSDAPRVPAPRHAVATPQAGGTLPPPGGDADTRRTQTGMPVVPPPPPTPRKGGGSDPDDPASPAAEPDR